MRKDSMLTAQYFQAKQYVVSQQDPLPKKNKKKSKYGVLTWGQWAWVVIV